MQSSALIQSKLSFGRLPAWLKCLAELHRVIPRPFRPWVGPDWMSEHHQPRRWADSLSDLVVGSDWLSEHPQPLIWKSGSESQSWTGGDSVEAEVPFREPGPTASSRPCILLCVTTRPEDSKRIFFVSSIFSHAIQPRVASGHGLHSAWGWLYIFHTDNKSPKGMQCQFCMAQSTQGWDE